MKLPFEKQNWKDERSSWFKIRHELQEKGFVDKVNEQAQDNKEVFIWYSVKKEEHILSLDSSSLSPFLTLHSLQIDGWVGV